MEAKSPCLGEDPECSREGRMRVRRFCCGLEQTPISPNALVPFLTLVTGRPLGRQGWGPPTTRGSLACMMLLCKLRLSTLGEPKAGTGVEGLTAQLPTPPRPCRSWGTRLVKVPEGPDLWMPASF